MAIFSSEQGGSTILAMEQMMLTATILSLSGSQGSVRVRRSTDLGATWGSPTIVASPASNTSTPSICGPDSSGRIYVWYINTSLSLTMKYSSDQGKTWVTP
jgi:Neuraminidase (sialidase)